MRSFLRLIIRYPAFTLILIAFISFIGIYSSYHMPVDLFPNLEIPVVNIITHYPGASPEDIEMLISCPIENEMKAIPGVKRISSISTQGLSQVTVEFTWGMKVRDVRQLVQTRLAKLSNLLPEGVKPSIENIGMTLQEVCGYVFYGGDLISLRNIIIHDIVGSLMEVSGVSSYRGSWWRQSCNLDRYKARCIGKTTSFYLRYYQ